MAKQSHLLERKEPPLSQVDQMDAFITDNESKILLKSALVNVFPQNVVIRYSDELQLLLDFLFFRFTTARGIQTPGFRFMNLKYSFSSKKQRMALLTVQVFLPYLISKVANFLQHMNWNDIQHIQRGSSLIQKLKYIIAQIFRLGIQLSRVAELVNFLGFMSNTVIKPGKPYKRNLSETFL